MELMLKLIYEIKEKRIKIFDSIFYDLNKNKCKMIIKNKLSPIKTEYKVKKTDNMRNLRLKLILFTNKNLNFKFMFSNCPIKKFSVSSSDPLENIEEKSNDSKNDIYQLFSQRTNKEQKLNSYKYLYKKNLCLFYISNKNKKNFDDIIINSHCFKSNTAMYKFIYNKNDDEFLINEYEDNSLTISEIRQKESISEKINLYQDYIFFSKLLNFNKKNFNTTVIDLSYMFYGCTSLVSISGISKFDISECTNISGLFEKCTSLKLLPDISKWNTKNIEDISRIFVDCSSLYNLPDISNWNLEKNKKMTGMFFGCKKLLSLPNISKWNTSNVSDMSYLFSECSSLNRFPNLHKWDTKNVENISYLFAGCSSLKSIPNISSWKINNVSDMNNLFSGCSTLGSLPDISKWNTDKVTNMSNLFNKYNLLKSIPDISKWKINNVTDISYMFSNCFSLENIPNILSWDTSQITDI